MCRDLNRQSSDPKSKQFSLTMYRVSLSYSLKFGISGIFIFFVIFLFYYIVVIISSFTHFFMCYFVL